MTSKTAERRRALQSYISSSITHRRRSIVLGVVGLITGVAVGQLHGFAGSIIALTAGAVLVVGPYITTMHIAGWRDELSSPTDVEEEPR